MSDQVQFEEYNFDQKKAVPPPTSNATGLIGFLIKKGVVKSAKQANIVLIVVAIICVVVIFIIMSSSFSHPQFAPSIDEIKSMPHK